MREWQRAVVAVGARRANGPPTLFGSGFCVDADAGLLITCAHVVEDIANNPGTLNIEEHGVAIGLGNPVEWRFVAHVKRVSHPPAPRHPDNGLDLAVLQLTSQLDGQALAAAPIPALPLGDSDPPALEDGMELVILGYGQSDTDRSETSTVTDGIYSGPLEDPCAVC